MCHRSLWSNNPIYRMRKPSQISCINRMILCNSMQLFYLAIFAQYGGSTAPDNAPANSGPAPITNTVPPPVAPAPVTPAPVTPAPAPAAPPAPATPAPSNGGGRPCTSGSIYDRLTGCGGSSPRSGGLYSRRGRY